MVFNDIYNHADDSLFPLELSKSKIMLYLSSDACSQYLPADFTDLLFEMIFLWTNKDPNVLMIKDFVFKRAVVNFKRHNPKAWCFHTDEIFDSNSSQFFVNKSIHLSSNGKRIYVSLMDIFNAFSIPSDKIDSIKSRYLDWLYQKNFKTKNFSIFDYAYLKKSDFTNLLHFFFEFDDRKNLVKQIFDSVNSNAINLYQKQFPNLEW